METGNSSIQISIKACCDDEMGRVVGLSCQRKSLRRSSSLPGSREARESGAVVSENASVWSRWVYDAICQKYVKKLCVSGWFFSSCFSCITCQAGLRIFEDSKALFYSHHKLRTVRLSAIFVFAALIFSWPPVTNTICFISYCLLCFCFFLLFGT